MPYQKNELPLKQAKHTGTLDNDDAKTYRAQFPFSSRRSNVSDSFVIGVICISLVAVIFVVVSVICLLKCGVKRVKRNGDKNDKLRRKEEKRHILEGRGLGARPKTTKYVGI